MTTRNLDALFQPRAIALIGASNEPGSVGAVLARNLFEGGFSGPILPVNPHEAAIRSSLNYRSITELPTAPDLAVIATPAPSVPAVVAELGARGCRAAVVISAGFSGSDAPLRQVLLDAARPNLMRVVGPNCLGFLSPARGINASFAHLMPPPGDVAFITQSGAIATTMLDWAVGRGIGFSHLISVGDMGDVDFGDLLDHLALDPATRSILLYVETVTSPRKFMSAARIAARAKPVIVVKSGRSRSGAKAAQSHTGALAGSDAVYDAAFQRAGMLRVFELRELFEAAATLATGVRPTGDRLGILTNGGGLGVLAADALEARGGRLADLSAGGLEALGKVLPKSWSHGNPVDILGDADPERFRRTAEILLREPAQDALLVMNCPTGVADSVAAAEAVATLARKSSTPVLSAWVGDVTASRARSMLRAAGVPAYETPDDAVAGFMHLVQYSANQASLREAPPAGSTPAPGGWGSAREIVAHVLADGRDLLTEPEAKAVLSAFDIPCVETLVAEHADDAGRLAAGIAGPVALKILSREITHKSDVGGVRLDLRTPEAVSSAAREMLATVASAAPGARVDGFTVQPMVRRPRAHELIVGLAEDATFGPIVLFGHGGVAVEVLADRSIGLPPLNRRLAREMIERTQVSRLLKGYRDRPAADVEAVAEVLVKLSTLLVALPQVVELDINPLLVDETGVLALDARILVRPSPEDPDARFAIRPYPSELERPALIRSGEAFLIRPVRPEDGRALACLLRADGQASGTLAPEAAERPDDWAARLSQIDYDREMTFAAFDGERALGVARMVSDPEFDSAAVFLSVHAAFRRRGLGSALMARLVEYATRRGLRCLRGQMLQSNEAMLQLVRDRGAAVVAADAYGVVSFEIPLRADASVIPRK